MKRNRIRFAKYCIFRYVDELFEQQMLVARHADRGLFTPTLAELEAALSEVPDARYDSRNTFYGLTTGALESFEQLKRLYADGEP